ncbi:SMC-Scp complex subunit ScpB [Aeromicrobium yanjiei]|uniref:SMC-Scp complex subunit ScpB n=1 Tax=Aeromicrobium yanjiei TaxID=2662028 RepID=A0A5Q2MKM8_9ACTN|nr:SMC-Scp complex subunit ScpB [Aeromicrobium yanjiei]QGG41626.1 SMC-Scp complex subunit ScpB [Aeromicrobium yanjiei]
MTDQHVPTGHHELELEMLDLKPALEAVLMVADQPLDHLVLAQAVGHPPTDVESALAELAQEYTDQGRGFELRNIAGGWRFFTREEFAGAVERFILDGQQARLTQAALETMAVVAYRQPITRSRISAIRGVNVDGVVRTLVTRGLIEESGVDGESGAILYRTTSYFLERMGLGDLSELPDIAQHLPDMDDMEDEGLPGAEEALAGVATQEPIAEAEPEAPATEGGDRG